MQSQSKGYLFLVIVLALTVLSGWAYTVKDYNLGLDVRGGARITFTMDTEKLTPEQRQRIGQVRANLVSILNRRVGKTLGVTEGNVQQKGSSDFIVELPGEKDVQRAIDTLGSSASIQLYHAKNVETEKAAFREYQIAPTSEKTSNPEVWFRRKRGTDAGKDLKPGDPEYAKMIEGWTLILQGDDLANATPSVQGNSTVPLMTFSGEGAKKLEDWSRKYYNRRENIAFVMDGRVLSIAGVKDGARLSDNAFIEGQFDPIYVKNLTDLLNSGALPVDLKVTSRAVVESTLGKPALDMMVTAGLISFAVIALFMVVYYVLPGVVALIALCLYVLFTLTVLKLIGATFSLASIAGFILSVGMAVDANILVFERVKEEMREGRQLMTSVELGFKRALPAIFDSNACTILTGLVLVNLGTGPVKGFASTLIIGVLISFFTAISVTRSLLVFIVGSGIGKNEKWFGLGRQWFGEGLEKDAHHKPLQIVNKAGRYFLISILTIIPGAIFMFMGGFKPNVEFQGGFEAVYKVGANVTAEQVYKSLESNGIKGSNVKFQSDNLNGRQVSITVPASAGVQAGDAAADKRIAEAAGVDPTQRLSFTEVGPSVQKETIENAVKGVILSSLLIIVYLTIRFGVALGGIRSGLKFGLSAILALVHDILVVLGVAAIVGYFAGWEISALFLTAMLTMIGFSVHDTIVIFDRIRENLRRQIKGEDFGNLCNRSITQSIARSINTSMTVIVTLAILVFFGTATIELKFFCLTMLVGILSGTYSSIFNAAPILYLWDRSIAKRKGEEYSLIGEAQREMDRARALQVQIEQERSGSTGAGEERAGSYSQVRRRSSAVTKAARPVDEDDDRP
ncbi:MAG: protein translocase subunit SecD [Fimbriimonadaceae bacterium]|nr:protein translocase subunit SecD [Fimbriimonadaceae bacterium]